MHAQSHPLRIVLLALSLTPAANAAAEVSLKDVEPIPTPAQDEHFALQESRPSKATGTRKEMIRRESYSGMEDPIIVTSQEGALRDSVANIPASPMASVQNPSDWAIIDSAMPAKTSRYASRRPAPAPKRAPVSIEALAPTEEPQPSKPFESSPEDIPVRGIIRAVETISIYAPMEGVLESLEAKPFDWVRKKGALASLESPESAALRLSSRGDFSDHNTMMEGFKEVFNALPIRTPSECIVTAVLAKVNTRVRAGEELFKAATSLRLEGTFPSAHSIPPGTLRSARLEFWFESNPEQRFRVKIEKPSSGRVLANLPLMAGLKTDSPWQGRLIRASH